MSCNVLHDRPMNNLPNSVIIHISQGKWWRMLGNAPRSILVKPVCMVQWPFTGGYFNPILICRNLFHPRILVKVIVMRYDNTLKLLQSILISLHNFN